MATAIGNVIRDLREQRGWSQKDLAARLNTSGSSISKKENGERRVHPTERPDFARAFDLTLTDFDARIQSEEELALQRSGRPIQVLNRSPAGVIDFRDNTILRMSLEGMRFADLDDVDMFAIEAVDNDMAPFVERGDIVFLRPVVHQDVKGGFVAFVVFDDVREFGYALIARLSRLRDDTILLTNRKHGAEPIMCTLDALASVAVATGIYRRIEPSPT